MGKGKTWSCNVVSYLVIKTPPTRYQVHPSSDEDVFVNKVIITSYSVITLLHLMLFMEPPVNILTTHTRGQPHKSRHGSTNKVHSCHLKCCNFNFSALNPRSMCCALLLTRVFVPWSFKSVQCLCTEQKSLIGVTKPFCL